MAMNDSFWLILHPLQPQPKTGHQKVYGCASNSKTESLYHNGSNRCNTKSFGKTDRMLTVLDNFANSL